MTYVRHDLPPVFIVQGADDNTVPTEQSIRLHDALDMDGVPNEIDMVPNAKHGLSREQWDPADEKDLRLPKSPRHRRPSSGPVAL